MYEQLVEQGRVELRWRYRRHALLEEGNPDLVVEQESAARAKRDGRELEWSRNDDFGYTVYLAKQRDERRSDRRRRSRS